MPSLKKLVVEGLPVLKRGSDHGPRDIAIWRLSFERWARNLNIGAYIIGPEPEEPDEEMARDALRYIVAAVGDDALAGDITSGQGVTRAIHAWAWIKDHWLSGMSESDILLQELDDLVYVEGRSIHAFLADFWLVLSNLAPTPSVDRACHLFTIKLPASYETYLDQADAAPGRSSVMVEGQVNKLASFRAWADKAVEKVQSGIAKRVARDRQRGAVSTDALATQLTNTATTIPLAEQLLGGTADSDTVSDILNALATMVSRGQGRRQPQSFTPKPQGAQGAGPSRPQQAAEIICYCCGKAGHRASECTVEPKPVCDHEICFQRGSTMHLPEWCPYKNPSCVRNPSIKARVEYDLRVFEAGKKAATGADGKRAVNALATDLSEQQWAFTDEELTAFSQAQEGDMDVLWTEALAGYQPCQQWPPLSVSPSQKGGVQMNVGMHLVNMLADFSSSLVRQVQSVSDSRLDRSMDRSYRGFRSNFFFLDESISLMVDSVCLAHEWGVYGITTSIGKLARDTSSLVASDGIALTVGYISRAILADSREARPRYVDVVWQAVVDGKLASATLLLNDFDLATGYQLTTGADTHTEFHNYSKYHHGYFEPIPLPGGGLTTWFWTDPWLPEGSDDHLEFKRLKWRFGVVPYHLVPSHLRQGRLRPLHSTFEEPESQASTGVHADHDYSSKGQGGPADPAGQHIQTTGLTAKRPRVRRPCTFNHSVWNPLRAYVRTAVSAIRRRRQELFSRLLAEGRARYARHAVALAVVYYSPTLRSWAGNVATNLRLRGQIGECQMYEGWTIHMWPSSTLHTAETYALVPMHPPRTALAGHIYVRGEAYSHLPFQNLLATNSVSPHDVMHAEVMQLRRHLSLVGRGQEYNPFRLEICAWYANETNGIYAALSEESYAQGALDDYDQHYHGVYTAGYGAEHELYIEMQEQKKARE